jgi:hypothetical protein
MAIKIPISISPVYIDHGGGFHYASSIFRSPGFNDGRVCLFTFALHFRVLSSLTLSHYLRELSRILGLSAHI